MKKTVNSFLKAKKEGNKLALLTAYDYSTAKLVDASDVDGILVGDSLGMVCLGYSNTLPVTIDNVVYHTQAVSRGVKNALLIGDMPFMSYQVSVAEAVRNAGRLIQEGKAEAVKLEGGTRVIPQIRAMVRAQIPVMGHLGLTPQSLLSLGGFRVQGKNQEEAAKMIDDAKKIEDAGVFSMVLECIPAELAAKISEAVSVPTISIGAGAGCDGQILVFHDIFGLYSDIKPKHVKVFVNAGEVMKQGITDYVREVKNGTFPGQEQSF